MTIRELCEKEVVQLEQGVCLGRADDLEFDPAAAQLQCLILLGRRQAMLLSCLPSQTSTVDLSVELH